MKCRSCSVEVAPIFASALMQNKCPACGKEIMTGREFKEMLRFKGLLAGLQLDDKLLVTIAAALSTKFDLLPKKLDGYGEVMLADMPVIPLPTDDQSIRERALQAALQTKKPPTRHPAMTRRAQAQEQEEDLDTAEAQEAMSEWGLQIGEGMATGGRQSKTKPSPELMAMFEDSAPPDLESLAFDPQASAQRNTERMMRLAKAEAAKNDPGTFKIKRAGYNYGD